MQQQLIDVENAFELLATHASIQARPSPALLSQRSTSLASMGKVLACKSARVYHSPCTSLHHHRVFLYTPTMLKCKILFF